MMMGQRFPITLRICRTISMRLIGHDLDVHFRVNAVYLLDKGFHFQIGGHKGDGFVRIRCFAGLGLAAVAASTPDACKNERRESFFIIILFSQFPDISKVAISSFYSKVGTNAT